MSKAYVNISNILTELELSIQLSNITAKERLTIFKKLQGISESIAMSSEEKVSTMSFIARNLSRIIGIHNPSELASKV